MIGNARGKTIILYKVDKESSEHVIFEQRFKEGEGESIEDIGERILVGTSMCKSPGVEPTVHL